LSYRVVLVPNLIDGFAIKSHCKLRSCNVETKDFGIPFDYLSTAVGNFYFKDILIAEYFSESFQIIIEIK
jgi:hypothetical protein